MVMRRHLFAWIMAATGVAALSGCASGALITRTRAAPAPQLTTGSLIPQTQPNPALRSYRYDSLRKFGNTTTGAALQYADPAVTVVNH